jgi:N-methylhydantoinase A
MRRIGIDVGGTFTDTVMVDEETGEVWSTKVPTTPTDPADGALNGICAILELSGSEAAQIGFIGHGTTIATNMVIEGHGAKTGLITTKGFQDILELRRGWRHDRADLYDLFFEAPPELVSRYLRREVDERILYDGSVRKALDDDDVRRCLDGLKKDGVEAVAICLINSPANSAHEERVLAQGRQEMNDTFVTSSTEVNPEIMEYERTCTTVVNAMLGPRCGRYATSFTTKARQLGVSGGIYFMQSNGGLAPPEAVFGRPVTLLESGPAGGVTAVARLCARMGIANAIAGDMGGTSFDVSLVRNSRPEMRNSTMLRSYTVRAPNIDIVSIGAGGGSIARIDEGGGVRIGPESAGADPGPVCYRRGGARPTVTDCNLVLGHIDPESFLGGNFSLDVEGARAAVKKHLADPLGVTPEEAALSVRNIANSLMAQAMRLVTVERGYDPRDFVYVPYGGAGPVHAVDLARELEIPTVVLPPMPGVFSAFGMLVSDLVYDLQTSVVKNVEDIDPANFGERVYRLEEQARSHMRQAGIEADDKVIIERRVDCSYLGQGDSMPIDVQNGPVDRALLDQIRTDFTQEHRRHWNFDVQGRPVRVINLRVRAVGKIGILSAGTSNDDKGAPRPIGKTRIWLRDAWVEMPRYRRADVRAGDRIEGPAVVEEASSRIAIYGGDTLQGSDGATLLVKVGRAS